MSTQHWTRKDAGDVCQGTYYSSQEEHTDTEKPRAVAQREMSYLNSGLSVWGQRRTSVKQNPTQTNKNHFDRSLFTGHRVLV